MSETKAAWIRRILFAVFAAGIFSVVWLRDDSGGKESAKTAAKAGSAEAAASAGEPKPEILHLRPTRDHEVAALQQELDETARKLGKQMPVVKILHFHIPANADSEMIADCLNIVAVKYNIQVLVVRLDVAAHAGLAAAEKVTDRPKVLIIAGDRRTCEFEGARPKDWIYKRVDEALWGLRRVGKDWRPEVKGMMKSAPAGNPHPESLPIKPQ
jgi:thioredoxin-like negative regulator of GroEL